MTTPIGWIVWEQLSWVFPPLRFWRVLQRSATHRMRIKNKQQQQQQRSLQVIFSNNLKSRTLVQTCYLFSETNDLGGIGKKKEQWEFFRRRLFTCMKHEGDWGKGCVSPRIGAKPPELSSGDSSGSHPKAACLSYQSLDKGKLIFKDHYQCPVVKRKPLGN